MQAKTFNRCVETLFWTNVVIFVAGVVLTVSIVSARLRGAPPYVAPTQFLTIAIVAECYVAVSSGVVAGMLRDRSAGARLRFLLLTLLGAVSAAAMGATWLLLGNYSVPWAPPV